MDSRALLQAQAQAHELRGSHLESVRSGFLTPEEIIELATQPGYEALRKIRLAKLLTAVQGYGEVTASKLLKELVHASKATDVHHGTTTVAWLIDRRACGRRLVIWANLRRPHQSPWPGFPYTPKPTRKVDRQA